MDLIIEKSSQQQVRGQLRQLYVVRKKNEGALFHPMQGCCYTVEGRPEVVILQSLRRSLTQEDLGKVIALIQTQSLRFSIPQTI